MTAEAPFRCPLRTQDGLGLGRNRHVEAGLAWASAFVANVLDTGLLPSTRFGQLPSCGTVWMSPVAMAPNMGWCRLSLRSSSQRVKRSRVQCHLQAAGKSSRVRWLTPGTRPLRHRRASNDVLTSPHQASPVRGFTRTAGSERPTPSASQAHKAQGNWLHPSTNLTRVLGQG